MRTQNPGQFKRLSIVINILLLVFGGGLAWNDTNYRVSDFDRDDNSLHDPSLCNNDAFSKNRNGNILFDNLNRTENRNFEETVTIGFLGSYRQTQVMLGALPLAVAAVNDDKGKDNNFSFKKE